MARFGPISKKHRGRQIKHHGTAARREPGVYPAESARLNGGGKFLAD